MSQPTSTPNIIIWCIDHQTKEIKSEPIPDKDVAGKSKDYVNLILCLFFATPNNVARVTEDKGKHYVICTPPKNVAFPYFVEKFQKYLPYGRYEEVNNTSLKVGKPLSVDPSWSWENGVAVSGGLPADEAVGLRDEMETRRRDHRLALGVSESHYYGSSGTGREIVIRRGSTILDLSRITISDYTPEELAEAFGITNIKGVYKSPKQLTGKHP